MTHDEGGRLARITEVKGAPKPIGPYSPATRAGGFLYLSGQTPLDPESGDVVAGGIAEQTERVLANLGAVLAAAGAWWPDVVKTTVFLTDMAHFAEMNAIYERVMHGAAPSRSTIAVRGLPRGALVEIELIALSRGARPRRRSAGLPIERMGPRVRIAPCPASRCVGGCPGVAHRR